MTTVASPLARATALRGLVEEHAESANAQGTMAPAVVAALEAEGLHRILVPAEFGGAQLDVGEAFEVVEELSYADGSTGWSTMASVVLLAVAGSFFDDGATARIFDDPAARAAGQVAPLGTAEETTDGYRVAGRFAFCSGGDHAGWLFGGFRELRDGAPVRLESGAPNIVVAAVPRSGVEFTANWDVLGLQATGSHDYEILDQVAPRGFTFPFFAGRPVRGTRTHELGPIGITAMGHAAFACGAGRRALDEMALVAASKRRAGRSKLIDDEPFQRDFAHASVRLSAARGEVLAALHDWEAAGAEATMVQRARGRLAATHAVETAVEVASVCYGYSGSTGLRRGSVLHRCHLDLTAARQHVFTDHHSVVDAGKVLLGVAGPATFL